MKKPTSIEGETFPDNEIARRRDEVVRRMAGTPPDHKTTPRPRNKSRKPTGSKQKGRDR